MHVGAYSSLPTRNHVECPKVCGCRGPHRSRQGRLAIGRRTASRSPRRTGGPTTQVKLCCSTSQSQAIATHSRYLFRCQVASPAPPNHGTHLRRAQWRHHGHKNGNALSSSTPDSGTRIVRSHQGTTNSRQAQDSGADRDQTHGWRRNNGSCYNRHCCCNKCHCRSNPHGHV